VFAIGNNSTAARFSGIPVNRIRLIIFTVTGLCSGLASILLTSRIGSTRPNIASGWELEIITTVVLGVVAITGGKGNIFGVIISICIIGFLKFGMGLINIPGKVMT
ncbi:branched-chain amino acid ABC transporter permease, partial [Desulfobacteraceae bacterium SEEP-SAG10]